MSATPKKVVNFWNLCPSASESGHHLSDSDSPTILYNDNDTCIKRVCIIWHLRQPDISSCVKTPFGSAFKTIHWKLSKLPAKQILPTSSLRRCGTVRTLVGSETLSCCVFWISSPSRFWSFIMHSSLLPRLWFLPRLGFLSPMATPPLWEFLLLLPSSGLLPTFCICQALVNRSFGPSSLI
jgi:hypothetical protein